MKRREDVNPQTGIEKYGNIEFADDVNNKYPIDTPEHIRAAWNYIHMPRDYDKYSKKDQEIIKKRIIKAWKEKISPDGPDKK